jgi:hypothetical protein
MALNLNLNNSYGQGARLDCSVSRFLHGAAPWLEDPAGSWHGEEAGWSGGQQQLGDCSAARARRGDGDCHTQMMTQSTLSCA